MAAGLPSTGIGGIFYLLLVLWMPLRELQMTIQGRSSLARWRGIAMHWFVVGCMIGMIFGQGYLMDAMCEWLLKISPLDSSLQLASMLLDDASSPAFALTPVALLLVVLGAVHVARAMAHRQDQTPLPTGTTTQAAGTTPTLVASEAATA
ncbi:MAG: hypothetical protein IT442_02885 [Phycisphaeraceae bacterium]|nr:hypothetical protein [Phycisphaeraceae bacterium]